MTIEDTLSTITPNNANSNSNSVDIISYFHQIHDSTYKKLFRHKLIIEDTADAFGLRRIEPLNFHAQIFISHL